MDSAVGTFYSNYRERILASVRERLIEDREQDPVLLALHEHLALDPTTGERCAAAGLRSDVARFYHQFLKENERLPSRSQLTLEEIGLVWRTLRVCYAEASQVQEALSSVFRLVERKMERGLIRQAWAILDIFEYERHVQVDNERNLFLEEMARRFARYAKDKRREVPEELRAALRAAADDLTLLPEALERLDSELGVRLFVLGTDHDERSAWNSLLGEAARAARAEAQSADDEPPVRPDEDTAPEVFDPSLLWTRKWRRPTGAPLHAGVPLLEDLVSPESVRAYLSSLLQGAYFLVLITESTGYEPFLAVFMRWLRDLAGPESMRVLSLLHSLLTLAERTTREAIRDLSGQELLAKLFGRLRDLDHDTLLAALRDVLRDAAEADLGAVPAGDYSLTGVILDRAAGLSHPVYELTWRLHRLI